MLNFPVGFWIRKECSVLQAIVLLSGGIDSIACINFYMQQGYEIKCIFCDYGQPGAIPESKAASKIATFFDLPLAKIKTTNISIPKSGEICGRNALLVFEALSFIGFGTYKIILGIHDGTTYSDCSPHFVTQMNHVIDCYGNGQIILEAPFIDWIKSEIVAYCRESNLPIELTYSCETGTVPPCGHCLSCLDRKEFLHE